MSDDKLAIIETHPRPDIWDNVAKEYSYEINENEKEIANGLIEIFQWLKLPENANLLELGSGSGHISGLLNKSGYNVTLLDFSQTALEKSKDFFSYYNLEGNFINGDIFDLTMIAPNYDIVWNSGVMEHFNDDKLLEALKSIKQVIKKYFIFLVPNPLSLPYLLFRYKKMRENNWQFGTEYLRKDYDVFLRKAGFKTLRKQYLGWNFTKYFISGAYESEDVYQYYKDLVDNNLIPEENAYLEVYVTTVEDAPVQSEIQDLTLKDSLTELKTKNFDLIAKYQGLKSLLETQGYNLEEIKSPQSEKLIQMKDEQISALNKAIEELKSQNEAIIEEKDKIILLKNNTLKEIEKYNFKLQDIIIENYVSISQKDELINKQEILVYEKENELRLKTEQLAEKELEISEIQRRIDELRANIEEKERIISEKQNLNEYQSEIISNQSNIITEKESLITELNENLNRINLVIQEKDQIINNINSELQNNLYIIQNLESKITEKDESITNLELAISEKDIVINQNAIDVQIRDNIINQKNSDIEALNRLLDEKEQLIKEKETLLEQRENLINYQKQLLDEKNIELHEKEIQIIDRDKLLKEKDELLLQKDNLIAFQYQQILSKDEQIKDIESEINDKNIQIQKLEETINFQIELVNQKNDEINEINLKLDEKQSIIEKQEELLDHLALLAEERNNLLNEKENLIIERNKSIEEKEDFIKQQSAVIRKIEESLANTRLELIERQNLISQLEFELEFRNEMIQDMDKAIFEKDQLIQNNSSLISEFEEEISKLNDELLKNKKILEYYEVKLEDKDEIINNQKYAIDNKEQTILNQREKIQEFEQRVIKLEETLENNNRVLNDTHARLKEKIDELYEKSIKITELEQQVSEKSHIIELKDQIILDKENLISEKLKTIKEKEELLVQYQAVIKEKDIALSEKDSEINDYINKNHIKEKIIEEKLEIIKWKDSVINEKEVALKISGETINRLDEQIKELDQSVFEKVILLEEKDQIIANKDTAIQNITAQRDSMYTQLNNLFASRSWMVVYYLQKLDKMLPFLKYPIIFAYRLFATYPSELLKSLKKWRARSKAKHLEGSGKKLEIQNKVSADAIRMIENLEQNVSIPKYDILFFAIIDWDFRYQRPQHLASGLAAKGHRVFYISVQLGQEATNTYRLIEPNVIEVKLPYRTQTAIYTEDIASNLDGLKEAMKKLYQEQSIKEAIAFVEFPMWQPLVSYVSDKFNAKIVFDALDEFAGFSNLNQKLKDYQDLLIHNSDVIIATAKKIYKMVKTETNKVNMLPNATEFRHFNVLPENDTLEAIPKPIIGYYGAIAEWFDSEVIEFVAESRPNWNIVLIGHTFGSDIEKLKNMKNVHFLGEKPYKELPKFLYWFDVCLIPFKLVDLILSTNPVKFFEYISSGKPVVASDLPELHPYSDIVYLSHNKEEFLNNIEKALVEKDENIIKKRIETAKNNDWEHRVDNLEKYTLEGFPKVSIIIINNNNARNLEYCIKNILENTAYPNYEILIVDNASTDNSRDYLIALESKFDFIKVIYNDKNLGFIKANNIGIKEASGEYLVLLSPEAVVPKGWINTMMKYLKDESIGMIGPTTNIKGNQTATNIAYNYYEEYLDFSEKVLYDNFYKYNDINELSLFCTMFRKEVVEKVGLIPDEKEETVYNKFEEYDYSIKIKNSGLRLICCKDLYVHVGTGSLREFHQKGQKKVAIIILSYNLLDKTTKPCIESIYRAKTHCDFEVLVVDNLSTDGTRDYLLSAKDEYKNLRLLFNEQNLGFAGGNNAGMKAIQADYYILLNSDTIVTDYWIDKIVDFMETHPEVGMAGPITNSAGNEQMIYVKSTTEEEIIKEGLEWANKHSKDYFFTNLLGFYCVAIRKEILDNVGYLDEAYGIGMFEDDDFSLRVMKAGYKLAVLENVFIYHKGSVSFSSLLTDEFRNKTFFKNLKYYEQKFNIKWKSKFNTDTFVEVIQHYLRNVDDSNADRIKEKIANRLEIMKNFDYAGKNLDNIMLWQQTLPKEQRFIE